MTRDKILGTLSGAAIGNAMGAATDSRTVDMILRDFGGFVRDLRDCPIDSYSAGAKAGHITADFSLAYETCVSVLEKGVTKEAAEDALLRWDKTPYSGPYLGPTTTSALERLRGAQGVNIDFGSPNLNKGFMRFDHHGHTNGAAMKAGPIALFGGGDMDKTLDTVLALCSVSHPNVVALSGACAIGAAVCEALGAHPTVHSIIEAGTYGAAEGYQRAFAWGRESAAASIRRRIPMAVALGLEHGHDFETLVREMGDRIGTNIPVVESVPSVFGFLAAKGDDAMEAIACGVNCGADTDTMATMLGAIVGAYHGSAPFPVQMLDTIEAQNPFNVRKLADDMADFLAVK